ncbi:MAG: hypothetical protein Aurels2KO_54010 [Aureliella sp.]
MPIHYRSMYTPYRIVPFGELRSAVESLEAKMIEYRKGQLTLERLLSARRKHYNCWRDVSVEEVGADSHQLAMVAEDLVNRNELNGRVIFLFQAAAISTWPVENDVEARIQEWVAGRIAQTDAEDVSPEYHHIPDLS